MNETLPVIFAKAPKCRTLGWLETESDEGVDIPIAACINLTSISFFYETEEKMVQAIAHTVAHELFHFIIRFELPVYYEEGEEEAVNKCVNYITPLPFESRSWRECEVDTNDDFMAAYALTIHANERTQKGQMKTHGT
jgi:hypothetical protein